MKEHSFLIDQRTIRKMIIGTVDVKTTNQIKNTLKRKISRQPKAQTKTQVSSVSLTSSDSESDDAQRPQPQCLEAAPAAATVPSVKPDITVDYGLVARTCDRYGVSDRAGAAIVSAVLHANRLDVVDKNKLRRKRKHARESIVAGSKVQQISALYFDGRKDKTLTITKKDGRNYRETILEEHISLIQEPGSIFLGYVAPASGTS